MSSGFLLFSGMQGHLWSETILTDDNFYYMIFPRMLAVAERSWHKAGWEKESSNITRHLAMRNDWDNFAHTIGKKELKRLDNMGIHYRVPPPGARYVNYNLLCFSICSKNWVLLTLSYITS